MILSFFCIQCTGGSSVRLARSRLSNLKDIQYARVLLESKPSEIIFSLNIDATLVSDEGERLLLETGSKLTFRSNKGVVSVFVDSKSYSASRFDINPQEDEQFLKYKNKTYRGIFRVKAGKGIMLINVLPLEDYLQAVIYPEMGPASKPAEFEALKAFAVCLRNYTYMKIRESKGEFDLYADHRDQVYNGIEGERPFAVKAIIETKDKILEYNGTLAKTFYFSSCGGSTENSDNVFSEKGIAYLRGVKDGDNSNCSIASAYRWTEEIPASMLLADLKNAKLIQTDNFTLSDVKIVSRFNSGRVNELKFYLQNAEGDDKTVSVFGNALRNVIKSPKTKGMLRSNWFDIEPVFDENCVTLIKMNGRGSGHGVGFCQWGAIGLSRKGLNYDEILYYYYPGTILGEI